MTIAIPAIITLALLYAAKRAQYIETPLEGRAYYRRPWAYYAAWTGSAASWAGWIVL
jgi:hypothetical protein